VVTYFLTHQYCLVVLVRLWDCGLDLRFLADAQICKLATPGSRICQSAFLPRRDVGALQAFNSALDRIVVQVGTFTNTYTYASIGYANPDAVTQIANGLSSTTYAYDNNAFRDNYVVGHTDRDLDKPRAKHLPWCGN
jgi:hypothetical protein